jgi:hypothetical protein
MPEPDVAPEPKVPLYKNPFLIAFLLGAAFLTVMPFVQRAFLKAPPPILQLTPWEVPSRAGGPVSSAALEGKVVLLSTELGPCAADCVERQAAFGTATRHVDDLKDAVVVVSVVGEGAREALQPLIAGASPAWRFAGGDDDAELTPLLSQLQAGLNAFLAPPGADFAKAHVIALLDQNGAVRGYWMADGAGRGNSINAARLLAKRGPDP